MPEDRAHELAPILERVGHGERVEHFQTKRVGKDGHIVDMSVTVSPIRDASGAVTDASMVARDMTETRRAGVDRRRVAAERGEERATLEGQLHKAQRLETMGQLAGGIAHDFNNLVVPVDEARRLLDDYCRSHGSSSMGSASIFEAAGQIARTYLPRRHHGTDDDGMTTTELRAAENLRSVRFELDSLIRVRLGDGQFTLWDEARYASLCQRELDLLRGGLTRRPTASTLCFGASTR
jgi:hypothetical protein